MVKRPASNQGTSRPTQQTSGYQQNSADKPSMTSAPASKPVQPKK